VLFAVRLERGGPWDWSRDAISAPTEQAVRERLAEDSWQKNRMLTVKSIEAWTILLDGRTAY
jgi:hypothetical protein